MKRPKRTIDFIYNELCVINCTIRIFKFSRFSNFLGIFNLLGYQILHCDTLSS